MMVEFTETVDDDELPRVSTALLLQVSGAFTVTVSAANVTVPCVPSSVMMSEALMLALPVVEMTPPFTV